MNKLLYKIELYLVKVIPMIYALLSLLNTTLSYFDINTVILSYIGPPVPPSEPVEEAPAAAIP